MGLSGSGGTTGGDFTPGRAGGRDGPRQINQLIFEIAETGRTVEQAELDRVLRHVADAGYPVVDDRAGPRLRGVRWKGHVIQENDVLPYAETHYLRHVIARREWPEGTTINEYLDSIRGVVLDPDSGVAISLWQGREWHLTIVCHSGSLRGPGGYEWIMVEYSPLGGYWVTAYQMELGLKRLTTSTRRRTGFRWLRDPK